jgi:hypothetical protein
VKKLKRQSNKGKYTWKHYVVVAIIVLGIICFFLFDHYYGEKHKFEVTPKVLEAATPKDVKEIKLLPLLYSYNPKCFTIEKNIVLSDKSVIHSFLEEMKGREKWSAGKWSTNRLVRILFVFKSGEKVAFRASLHMDIEMAEYSVLSGVSEIYDGPNYANTGGAGLSKLLKATIKKSGVRWVNSSKDYWKIVSGTELIVVKYINFLSWMKLMRLDTKFGQWAFVGSSIMLIFGTILLVNGAKSGLFFIAIGGYIFFRIVADPR